MSQAHSRIPPPPPLFFPQPWSKNSFSAASGAKLASSVGLTTAASSSTASFLPQPWSKASFHAGTKSTSVSLTTPVAADDLSDDDDDYFYRLGQPESEFYSCGRSMDLNCCDDSSSSGGDDDDSEEGYNISKNNMPGQGWANKKTKIVDECGCDDHAVERNKKSKVSKSFEMKDRALNRKIKDFIKYENCNAECTHGRKCLSYVDFSIVTDLAEQFWGIETDDPKLPKERKQGMMSLYETLDAGFDVCFCQIRFVNKLFTS